MSIVLYLGKLFKINLVYHFWTVKKDPYKIKLSSIFIKHTLKSKMVFFSQTIHDPINKIVLKLSTIEKVEIWTSSQEEESEGVPVS